MKKRGNVLLSIVLIIVCAVAIVFADIIIANANTSKNLSEGYSGDTSRSGLIDECGMFDDSPETVEKLEKRIRQCSEKTEMNIFVYIAGSPHYGYSLEKIQEFDDVFYDDTFGEYTDGLVYYMDFSGQSPAEDDISKSGRACMVYDDDVCQKIFSALDAYLPKSGHSYDPRDISTAIEVFCEKLEYYNENFTPKWYKYYHDKVSSPSVYVYIKDGDTYVTKGHAPGSKMIRLLIAELIGFVAGLVTYLIINSHYKFKSSANPSVYVSHEKSSITEKSDVLIRSYVTKHKISSSSGGGRSGGGGHSHGGSHSHSSHSR